MELMSRLFFPSEDRYASLMSTFGVFAVGFLMRPLGAAFFGSLGDKYGRKFALLVSIVFMSVPVALIALAPTYAQIGFWAPVLLIFARLLQGIAIGGEAGNAAFLIEHSSGAKNRGLLGSFEVLSAVFGIISGLLVMTTLRQVLGEVSFTVWGWRMGFVLGFIIGILSIVLRYYTAESPEYSQLEGAGKVVKSPLGMLLKTQWRRLLICVGLDAAENAAFYMYAVFFGVFLSEKHPDLNNKLDFAIATIGALVLGGLTIWLAHLSDIIGRRKVMISSCIMFLVVSCPVLLLLELGETWSILLAYGLFAIPLAGTLGPSSAAIAELFPTQVRYSGFGLARNISGGVFGGLAPTICTWLISISGGVGYYAGFYMMGVALLCIFSLLQTAKLHDEVVNEKVIIGHMYKS